MVHEALVKKFDDLEARAEQIQLTHSPARTIPGSALQVQLNAAKRVPTPINIPASSFFAEADCLPWAIEASEAIEGAFPAHSSTRQHWSQVFDPSKNVGVYFDRLRAMFRGAASIVRKGHLRSLAEGVQAETLGELLDQADWLLERGCLPAAAGIAGGALETHLRHLVDRHGLTVQGHGSIEKYNLLIGEARKRGAEIYSLGDQKQITTWGDIRNEADHRPLKFAPNKEQVSLMIQGIRLFLTRVP